MQDGAATGVCGGEQGVQDRSSLDHRRGLPLAQNSGVLGLSRLLRNGYPRGSFLPLPVISQQSKLLCKRPGLRADHDPFLSGKGLFACFL